MNILKNILGFIFRRDYLLVILLIIGAFLGAVGIPQSLGYKADQLLLTLLGVLALDTLLERLGYLDRIEKRLAELETKIESRPNVDDLFRTRDELRSFTSWLLEGKELWVLGKDLSELMSRFGAQIQQEAIGKKKRFRFLVMDPSDQSLIKVAAAGSYLNPDVQTQEAIIRQTLDILKRITEGVPQNAIEVRLLSCYPTNSYVILDYNKEHGQIVVEPFGNKITSAERQHMVLRRTVDTQTFAFHLKQFETMWKDAKPL
jgi:hypothetical protein